MAKAKRKQQGEAAPKARRGGRKPGKWTLVTPEQIKAYRADNKVSRARLAQLLGVSSTSVQNWETGTTATTRIQQRLAELIAAGPVTTPPPRLPSLWDAPASAGERDAAVTATGAIVAGYVGAKKNVSAEELVGLIRSVRQALS